MCCSPRLVRVSAWPASAAADPPSSRRDLEVPPRRATRSGDSRRKNPATTTEVILHFRARFPPGGSSGGMPGIRDPSRFSPSIFIPGKRFTCGEPRRESRDCPLKGGGGGDRSCFNCGGGGHLARDCARPPKPRGFFQSLRCSLMDCNIFHSFQGTPRAASAASPATPPAIVATREVRSIFAFSVLGGVCMCVCLFQRGARRTATTNRMIWPPTRSST